MTKKQLYLYGCNFAIHQLTKYGSREFIIHDENDMPITVLWDDILNWLNEEYEKEMRNNK